MSDFAAGVVVSVRAVVTTADDGAGTATLRVIDNNDNPLTAPVTLPQGVLTVVEPLLAVGDVIERAESGETAVVRWVDGLRWSSIASGGNSRSSRGWRKVGRFAASP